MNGEHPNQDAQQGSHWQYRPESPSGPPGGLPAGIQSPSPQQEYEDSVTWTASEFIAHEKGTSWYVLLALVLVVLITGVYLWTRDLVAVAAIVIMGGIFGYTASRPPHVQEYTLSRRGVSIGQKQYSFSQFRSFSVVQEGAFSSIVFWPIKRIGFPVGIYYDPQDEDKIIDVISAQLPIVPHEPGYVEQLMRRIHF